MSKFADSHEALRFVIYKSISKLYPTTSWFRVLTDGSKTADCVNAGAEVFREIFLFNSSVGSSMSEFDGEIFVIRLTFNQLLYR